MSLRRRLALGLLAVVTLATASFAIAISYNAPCTAPPVADTHDSAISAVTFSCYGGPEVLTLVTRAKPTPQDDQVLVRIRAAGMNPLDWHMMRGEPYFMRLMGMGLGAPVDSRVGVDYAGIVEAVGKNVTRFKPGDEVLGGYDGAYAEYLAVGANSAIVMKPPAATFEEAAAIPIAAITALQGLRDQGRLQAGQRVLINGASGGVGTFAVQVAKSMGAHVTGVCSTRNVELVRSLGADTIVDYTKHDFTDTAERYDLILDNVGSQPLGKMRDVLTPTGRIVIVGGVSRDPWLGPMIEPLKAMVSAPFVEHETGMFISSMKQADLQVLSELMAAGKIRSVVDRTYPLADVKEAMTYLETGRARGKVVLVMP